MLAPLTWQLGRTASLACDGNSLSPLTEVAPALSVFSWMQVTPVSWSAPLVSRRPSKLVLEATS